MEKDKEKARSYFDKAKEYCTIHGDSLETFRVCLKLMNKAYSLYPRDKYAKKVEELTQIIQEIEEDQSDTSKSSSSSDDEFSFREIGKKKSVKPRIEDDDEEEEQKEEKIVKKKTRKSRISDEDDGVDQVAEAVGGLSVSSVGSEPVAGTSGLSGSKRNKKKESVFTEVEGYEVKTQMYKQLYGYQIEGLIWLIKLYNQGKNNGCILADDMGLGKTVQTITFVSTLLHNEKIKSVMIIAPNTLLANWAREFKRWYPEVEIFRYHDATPKNRLINLGYVQRNGGVLFTTYGMLQNHIQFLGVNQRTKREFVWDIVVMDEAHKIKNPTKTTRAASDLPSLFRLAITGTPVQNNLRELWSIYDWAKKGTLFGGYTSFKLQYELPITKARSKDASDRAKRIGTELAQDLRKIYEPYFLRRTKDEVLSKRRSLSGGSLLPAALPPKYDWVCWIRLSDNQIAIYKDILNSTDVRHVLSLRNKGGKGALVQLTFLKKLCDSMFLIPYSVIKSILQRNRRRRGKKALDESVLDVLVGDDEDGSSGGLVSINSVDIDEVLDDTAKLAFLVDLLENLKSNGHRTLVFSQSTRMLDIIQKVLQKRNFKLARLDGRVPMKLRETYVNTFQSSNEIHVCLLSSQVGGVGLTLTNADRVVIYDPSWNPGTDAQAVDRVYRIGQTKPVIVYRLITCGSVEERIFRRQIFKNSVIKQMVQNEKDPTRYFTENDITELFKFEKYQVSETCQQLEQMHSAQRKPCPQTDEHREEVMGFSQIVGISDHALLFSLQSESEEHLEEGHEEQVHNQVKESRLKMEQEALNTLRTLEQNEMYCKPYELAVPDRVKPEEKAFDDSLPNPTEIDEVILDDSSLENSVFFDQPTIDVEDEPIMVELDMPVASRMNKSSTTAAGREHDLMDEEDTEVGVQDETMDLSESESDLAHSSLQQQEAISLTQELVISSESEAESSVHPNPKKDRSGGDISLLDNSNDSLSNDLNVADISFRPSQVFHSTAINPGILAASFSENEEDEEEASSKSPVFDVPSDEGLDPEKTILMDQSNMGSPKNSSVYESPASKSLSNNPVPQTSNLSNQHLYSLRDLTANTSRNNKYAYVSSDSETSATEEKEEDDDPSPSPVFDVPSPEVTELSQLLNQIEVTPFDRTNLALKPVERMKEKVDDMDSQDYGARSPVFDPVSSEVKSQGDASICGLNDASSFHLNSLLATTPSKLDATL